MCGVLTYLWHLIGILLNFVTSARFVTEAKFFRKFFYMLSVAKCYPMHFALSMKF